MKFDRSARDRIIDLIGEASLDPARWNDVLNAVRDTYDASGLLAVYDLHSRKPRFSRVYSPDPNVPISYSAYFEALNPYPLSALAIDTDRVFHVDELVPADVMRRTEFYNDFLKPADYSLRHLGLKPIHDRHLIAVFSCGPPASAFDETPEAYFAEIDALRPHIRRALEINRRLAVGDMLGEAFRAPLDRRDIATFLLDVSGRPINLSYGAEQMLRAGDVLKVERSTGVLKAIARAANEQLAAMISGGGKAKPIIVKLTSRLNDGLGWLAWAVPVPSRKREGASPLIDAALAPKAHVLLLVTSPDPAWHISAEAIQIAFELTPAEARVAAALVAGDTIQDYAARAGVTPKTARNQLASICAKLGVSRQSELVAKVHSALNRGLFGASDWNGGFSERSNLNYAGRDSGALR